jgi:hypothetical protein
MIIKIGILKSMPIFFSDYETSKVFKTLEVVLSISFSVFYKMIF